MYANFLILKTNLLGMFDLLHFYRCVLQVQGMPDALLFKPENSLFLLKKTVVALSLYENDMRTNPKINNSDNNTF